MKQSVVTSSLKQISESSTRKLTLT